jgi:hypothetical protein
MSRTGLRYVSTSKPTFDVKLVIGEGIREPDFAARIRAEGMALPDLEIAEAVTLDRVIVGRQPLSHPTLVHELINLVQYSLLGG